jgi:mannose-binding lectin
MALYAQTSGTQSTNSGTFVSIPGLTLTIPAGVNDAALVVVNLPNPYATGNNYPGAVVGISVDGTVSPVQACFTYSEQQMPFPGRVPTTLVVSVPLTNNPQTVNAVWYGVRGSTVIIDSPATMSAVFG